MQAPEPKKLYVLSEEEPAANASTQAVKYYVNNVASTILDGITHQGNAIDMAVDGNNLYILSLKHTIGTNISEYVVYKNGIAIQTFPDNEGEFTPSCIAAKGADLYVAGDDLNTTFNGSYLQYWKNGTMTIVSDGSKYARCSKILLNGTDIYLAGYEAPQGGNKTATYWKNGTKVQLPALTGLVNATIKDLAIAGTDVYASGVCAGRPCYWKNNTVYELSSPLNSGDGLGITTSGTDVYVAGYLRNSAGYQSAYWKNGDAPVLLTTNASDAAANDIAVDGTDIYVAGYHSETGNVYKSSYWKNGTETILTGSGANGQVTRILIQ